MQLRARLDGPLAVVTHGLVIKAILRGHVRLPEGVTVPDRIGNTSISVLDASPPHALSLLDCVTHLEGKLLEDGSSLSGG